MADTMLIWLITWAAAARAEVARSGRVARAGLAAACGPPPPSLPFPLRVAIPYPRV
jgi:hypothetical protein